MIEKIPIRIVELTSPSGKKAVDIMIDLYDYNKIMHGNEEIKRFKKKYFQLIQKTQDLFYKKNLDKKKKNKPLPSSIYWKLGSLFRKFDDDIKNKFVIVNYTEALERDFGLSRKYIKELIVFSELFMEEEIMDNIPMATYRALVWKKNQLEKIGILSKEKKRLSKMGRDKHPPGREKYKIELINAIQNELSKNKK